MATAVIPESGVNNIWYYRGHGDTVVVFIHGIFSDSRHCWLRDDTPRHYWPALVRADARFGDAAIFLGGFFTQMDAGDYDLADCANELLGALKRPEMQGGSPLLSSYRRLFFICHSTGGIVVRYMLERWAEDFDRHPTGVALIASPSLGSDWANLAQDLARFYKQKLGLQLRVGGASLEDLDERFRDLVARRTPALLQGGEAHENRSIFHRKWLPPVMRRVVEPFSAARGYWGSPVNLAGTDHFSAVKPISAVHPAHTFVVDTWTRFIDATGGAAPLGKWEPTEPPEDLAKAPEVRPVVASRRYAPYAALALLLAAAGVFYFWRAMRSSPQRGPAPSPIPTNSTTRSPKADSEPEIERLVQQMDVRALLGQALVVGFATAKDHDDTNARLADLVREYGIGSVILYGFNFPDEHTALPGETASYVARLTANLRRAAYESQPPGQAIPPFIAIDQEGGFNVRLTRDVTRMPNEIHVGATRDPVVAERIGASIGKELAALGMNVNFSPVADINTQHVDDLIGRRAFSSRPDVAAALAVAWAQGLQQGGVLAIAKHFPGHGNTKADPHLVLASMGYKTRTELDKNDAIPFKAVAQGGVDGIMTSHMLTPLDADLPVTLSPRAIRYLRQDLRFDGLVVTDDIVDMMGILMNEDGRIIRDRATVAIQAIRAGHDLVLFGCVALGELPENPERTVTRPEFDAIHTTLLRHFESHPDDREALRNSVRRILRAKARVAPLAGTPDRWGRPFDPDAFRALVAENSQFAREVAGASAILITERGRVIEHLTEAAHFRDGIGPLNRGQLWDKDDRILLVSPAVSPPDPLHEALQNSWIPRDRIDYHPLVYGWSDEAGRRRASQLWKRAVPEYSNTSAITRRTTYYDATINAEVEAIVAEAQRARVVIVGALKHDQLKVLTRVCRRLRGPTHEIIVLLFKEPYFLPDDVYAQRNVTVLQLSPWPTTAVAAELLLGRRRPLAAAALPVAVPGIVERPAGLNPD